MNKEYLDAFENKLEQELLKLCTSYNMLGGVLLSTDDLNEKWHIIAPEYMADAVGQIKDYPTVSVAWAGYLGMAYAYGWDFDWEIYSHAEYKSFYGKQGFDDMDEYIVENVLGISLDSNDAQMIEKIMRICGQTTVAYIRNEQVEPQSQLAFFIFARACKVMFRIGVAIELKRLGYKFERVDNLN